MCNTLWSVNVENASMKPSLKIRSCTTFDSFLSQWFQHLSSFPTFSHGLDTSMVRFFEIHLARSSLHGKISFQFRFWAHFFAFRNPDTRLKIFPIALKKFALRAENPSPVFESWTADIPAQWPYGAKHFTNSSVTDRAPPLGSNKLKGWVGWII